MNKLSRREKRKSSEIKKKSEKNCKSWNERIAEQFLDLNACVQIRTLKIEQWRNEPKGPLNSEYSEKLYEEQELNSSKEYKMSARNE